MNFLAFSVLNFLIVLSSSQRLIPLKTLIGNNENNSIFNGTTAIYVTAAMDDVELLKQIRIDSSDSGSISIYDLTQQKTKSNSDFLNPWVGKGVTTLTTSLTQQQVNSLAGSVYCTSEQQATNPQHLVFDVSQVQNVNIPPGEATLVFLNSRTIDSNHMHSTSFSNWVQGTGSSVKIYQNIPLDSPEPDSTQIFSNPVTLNEKPVLVPNVNDFSITHPVFYMRVSGTGSFLFKSSPDYYDINNTRTKGFTTTGFFMKSVSGAENNIQVQLMHDPDFIEATGVNCIGDIPQNADVTVSLVNTFQSLNKTFSQSDQVIEWRTNFMGNKLILIPRSTAGGQYFIQYFTIQGQRVLEAVTGETTTVVPVTGSTVTSSSSTVSTSTSSIQTSTKSSGKLKFFVPIMISIIAFKTFFVN